MKNSPQRICIIGPSSTGKSTLAHRIGEKLSIPVIHLDMQHHYADGNWVARPQEEYVALHDAAIAKDQWIIEGNYTRSMPKRFANADLIVCMKMNRFGCLYRFLKRHIQAKCGGKRYGMPKNVDDSLKLSMLWWIIQPISWDKKRRKKEKLRQEILQTHSNKVIILKSFKEMECFLQNL